ncbi:MAG: LysE family translocator [Rubrivivax sp.]|nr:LysE family translocator [Rubrivivax sp.]
MLSDLLPGPAAALVFAGAVAVLNATPGVDFLLTVTRTLAGGMRAGVATALGISAGCVVHALAAAFGLAALLALHPGAFVALQWAGAAWLAWLGLRLLRQAWRSEAAAAPAAAARGAAGPSWRGEFRNGLLTNLLNPKVALFFLAFLPPFVPAGSPDKTLSFLLLGAWFVLQGTAFLLVLVALAAHLARWQPSPMAQRWLSALGGGLFLALALRLVAGRPAAA